MSDFILGIEEKYPAELLKGRKNIEGNIIACLYKDILLIDEAKLENKDFITKDGSFYFNIANNIRKLGYTSLDDITVRTNIDELSIENYNEMGGWETLEHITSIVNSENWDTYLDNIQRENDLIKFYNDGFNLFKPIVEDGKEIIPIKLFRQMDSESVLDWYESRLSNFTTGRSSRILEEDDMQISEDFIEGIYDGEEGFVPFDKLFEDCEGDNAYALPYISNHMIGYLHGTSNCLAGHSSTGKTTILSSIILGLINRGEKVLIASNEQKAKAFKVQFLLLILVKHFKYTKVTKKRFLAGQDNLTNEDRLMIEKARVFWNDNYRGKIAFIKIADSDMSTVKKKVREYKLRKGYTAFLYDTFKLDFTTIGNDNNSSWLGLMRDSRTLDALAAKYDMIGIYSMQLALNTLGKLFLDASCLSNCKGVKEVLETLLLMRSVYSEELDPENKRYYCRPFQRKQIGGKWVEEEYIADTSAVYKMLFFDKTRSAENSSDTGIALLLKFNGALGTFKEVAWCRPRHGTIS